MILLHQSFTSIGSLAFACVMSKNPVFSFSGIAWIQKQTDGRTDS